MSQVLDLITEALQVTQIVGAAQPVPDRLAQVTLKCIAGLLDTANADPLKKATSSTALYNLIPGQQAYTIGLDASMNFNAMRPTEIVIANIVNTSNATYPIRTPLRILTDAQWAEIQLQNVPTPIPDALWYDEGYAQIGTTLQGYGTINFHGVPSAAYKVELWTAQPLTIYSAYTDTLILPPAYYEWLLYGTCIRLYPRFARPVDETVLGLFKDALLKLESGNVETPILSLDSGLPGANRAWFDARTNRYIP